VDDRHRKSGTYWDHFECGGHYCRPLSAWSIVLAAAGFSANLLNYKFAPKIPGEMIKLFVTGADFTGTYKHDIFDKNVNFTVDSGLMKTKSIEIEIPSVQWDEIQVAVDEKDLEGNYEVVRNNNSITVVFNEIIDICKDFTIKSCY